LAGLQVFEHCYCRSGVRKKLIKEIQKLATVTQHMGLVACQAAFGMVPPLVEDLLEYLIGESRFLRDFIKDRLPQIRLWSLREPTWFGLISALWA
jgi:cystathionine beta-lyase